MTEVLNTTIGLRKKSVLCVEDHQTTLEDVAQVVTEAGLVPTLAATRKDAILLCDRQAFDVAVVDKILIQDDMNNRDGLAILRHIARKNEGTQMILLTGHGRFRDVVELEKEIPAFKKMIKGPDLEEELRRELSEAVAPHGPVPEKGSVARLFCGKDNPVNWENGVKAFLKPVIALPEVMNLLNEIAHTCTPMLERIVDNGIQRTDVEAVMAGLYWSRGVGEAVVVVLARNNIPEEIPRLDTWPSSLTFGEVMFQIRRKNLVGAIIRAGGIAHTDFAVKRSTAA